MPGKLAADDPRHGTLNAYSNWECRCPACREAWKHYTLNKRHRYRDSGGLPADDPRHGRDNTYVNYQCRCPLCVEAHSTQMKLRRKKGRKQ